MRRFSPRKALGQSFLMHTPTAEALVGALEAGPDDTVVEIGPGRGALTKLLVGRVRRLVAVEIDERLALRLLEGLGGSDGFQVVIADFLHWNQDFAESVKVIGNLPYSASSPMVFRLLDDFTCWTVAVLTTQREFARRVLGGPGSKDYSALSVFCERLCRRERLLTIPGRYFRPRPDVVSTSFRLERRQQPLFPVDDESFFRRVVRSAFAQRRKTLANNLVAGLNITRDAAEGALSRAGIDIRCRAESVPGDKFSALTTVLQRR